MSLGFLDHMRVVSDHRIPGMGHLSPGRGAAGDAGWRRVRGGRLGGCGGDRDRGVGLAALLSVVRQRHPDGADFAQGFSLAGHVGFATRLCPWSASLRAEAREVIAVDGKTLRGSKTSPDGKGALHVVSAYATEAGLVLAQQAVDGKSNEITAIPELLD